MDDFALPGIFHDKGGWTPGDIWHVDVAEGGELAAALTVNLSAQPGCEAVACLPGPQGTGAVTRPLPRPWGPGGLAVSEGPQGGGCGQVPPWVEGCALTGCAHVPAPGAYLGALQDHAGPARVLTQ